jgi:hypothetical protein
VRVRKVPRAAADPPISCFIVFMLEADFRLMPKRGNDRVAECAHVTLISYLYEIPAICE